jgi:hypothetical protein
MVVVVFYKDVILNLVFPPARPTTGIGAEEEVMVKFFKTLSASLDILSTIL